MISALAGAAALYAVAPLERAIYGGPLPYEPRFIAGSTAKGIAARLAYATVLGTLYRALRPPPIAFASAVWMFELVAMPAVGAVAPLRQWKPRGIALLALHVALFTAVMVSCEKRSSS